MKFCKACNQNVMPTKKFSVVWFLIDLLTIVGGGIYIIYYLFFKKKGCPICGNNHLEHKHDEETIGTDGLPKNTHYDDMVIKMKAERKANGNITPDYLTKQLEEDKLKPTELSIAKDKYAESKAKTAETIRKRKAGELPWQIKKKEKKLAKLNKI